MDISDNIVIKKSILKKIIVYLINHYNHYDENKDKAYYFILNFMIVYLKLLISK